MNAKLFELRDAATFIPVLCVQVEPANEAEAYLLRRGGFVSEQFGHLVYMIGLEDQNGKATCEPHAWGGNRTRHFAHRYIADHWNELPTGAVVDVEFIMGLTDKPKVSERVEQEREQSDDD